MFLKAIWMLNKAILSNLFKGFFSDSKIEVKRWNMEKNSMFGKWIYLRVQRGSSPRLEGRGLSSPSIDLDYRGSLGEGRGLIIPKILYFIRYSILIFYYELHLFVFGGRSWHLFVYTDFKYNHIEPIVPLCKCSHIDVYKVSPIST